MSENVEERLNALESTVEELLEENRRKDERIKELEAELEQRPPLTLKGDYDRDDHGAKLADSIYLNGWNIGESLKRRAMSDDVEELDERVADLENDAVTETVEIDRGNLLPIERDMHDRQSGDHDLRGNRLRATYVYEEFQNHARSEGGRLKLPSSQVKNIHRKHDLDDNRNTIRRTMQMVAKHSAKLPKGERQPDHPENLIRLEEATSKNVLVADKEAWIDHHQPGDDSDAESEDTPDGVEDEIADAWDAMDGAEPVHHSSGNRAVTDGGEDTQ